jgi:arylsulfatase A-like enzyme
VYTVGGIDRFAWWKRSLRPVENVAKLPLDRVTVAQVLKKAGYATGMFGKWHLGEQGDHHPSKRGFDEAIATMGRHFNFATNPKVEVPEGQYLADFLTDRAVDFIRRKKDGPFFLYLPHFAVHSPFQAKPELVERFRKKAAVGGHHDPVYAAMIAVLEELKLAENTVVVFSSDYGGVGGYVREGLKKAGDVTDNAPLRSGKGSLYEGGTRVPLIVRWPAKTNAGSTCDVPSTHVDFLPTCIEIAGAEKPAQALDGASLVPLLRDATAKLERAAIFQHCPGYLGAGANTWRTTPVGTIISGDWKLMEFFEDGRLELYNLRDDAGETRNLAATESAKAKELHAQLVAWRKEIGAPMPTPHKAGEKPASAGKSAGGDED